MCLLSVFPCQLMNLPYSTLAAQGSPLFLSSLKGCTYLDAYLATGLSRVCFQLRKVASLLELWVCGPMGMMASTHIWFEGGRGHSQHTLLSNFQSSANSRVSRVIRFMICHREQFLPLTYLDYRYKHKHSSGASKFWPKLGLIWLSSHARSSFLNYGSLPASTLK